ncbi:MAG: hypothetical protein KGI27_09780 [Thaumarchaeota archaeon]|nr:hypothetical protein [Nitrososphaerota archaeon]
MARNTGGSQGEYFSSLDVGDQCRSGGGAMKDIVLMEIFSSRPGTTEAKCDCGWSTYGPDPQRVLDSALTHTMTEHPDVEVQA